MSTVNPQQTKTYSLTTQSNPITFGGATDIKVSNVDAVSANVDAIWTVTNDGLLYATGASGAGIALGGGSVTNAGTISGNNKDGLYAIGFAENIGSVTNSGTLKGFFAGVDMVGGGSVTNNQGGVISGEAIGVEIDDYTHGTPGTDKVVNAGTISGYLTGVALESGGTLTNKATGVITGAMNAVAVEGGSSLSSVVNNSGEIKATGFGDRGIEFMSGGTVTNSGTVEDASGTGVYLNAGGAVTNKSGGYIAGASYGIYAKSYADYGAATTDAVTNAGRIVGTGGLHGVRHSTENRRFGGKSERRRHQRRRRRRVAGRGLHSCQFGDERRNDRGDRYKNANGVSFDTSGNVYNSKGGVIRGAVGVDTAGGADTSVMVTNFGTITSPGAIETPSDGVYINAGTAEVTNSGTISGYNAAIVFAGGNNTLTLETGSILNGAVVGSTATDATNGLFLEGKGTAANEFTNFQSLTVETGAVWTLGAALDIGATWIEGGALTVTGALTSAVTFTNANFGSGNNAGALILGSTDRGAISGFGLGNSIVFKSATYSHSDLVTVSDRGVVTISNGGNPVASFDVTGSYTPANFTLGAAVGGGLEVGYTSTDGLIDTVTVAQYLLEQTALDQDPNGFEIDDTVTNLKSLTAAELAKKTADGPVTLFAEPTLSAPRLSVTQSIGVTSTLSFNVSQTAAIEGDGFFVKAAGGILVEEHFADGGYDEASFYTTDFASIEELFAGGATTGSLSPKPYATAEGSDGGSEDLTLAAGGLSTFCSSAGMAVTRGSDTSWIVPLNADSSETITASTRLSNETFKFASGFGQDTVDGFRLTGTTAAPADTLELDTKMFAGLSPTNTASQDWTILTTGANPAVNLSTDNILTITDLAGDTLTLSGISSLTALGKDVKFFTK